MRFKVEFATSFKMVLDNWNMQTQNWLKYVCYDRTGSVYGTMILSAFWFVASVLCVPCLDCDQSSVLTAAPRTGTASTPGTTSRFSLAP